jgi:geranylgeranyl diphosphate synthase type I
MTPPRPSSRRAPRSGGLPRGEAGRADAAFASHLAAMRRSIDQRLEAAWDAKRAALADHGAAVLAMVDAARDLTLRGGKRFRAALLAAAYAGVDPDAPREVALAAGAAIELLQSYLLMQDDWIDGDVTRRGGPSAHAALERALGSAYLGASSAILASDLTWGFALDTLAGCGAPPARLVRVIRLFCRIHEDVVVGQELDVIGAAEDVEAMHALKTGSYTVRGPLLLGAALAGASARQAAALEAYAAPLGVAFQLRDDLLGAFGTEAETGKPEGGDLRAGKRTAVIAEAEGRLDAAGRRALARAFGKARADASAVAAATAALDACGARRAVSARLAELCDAAGREARALPIDGGARAVLEGAASALRVVSPAAAAALGTPRRGAS